MHVCQVCASSSTVRLCDITPSCRVMFFMYMNIAETQRPWIREKNSLLLFTSSSTQQHFSPTRRPTGLRRELMKSFCVSGRLYPTDTGESMMDFLPCLYTGLGQLSSPPEKRKHFFCCFPLSLYCIHFCVSGGSGFLQKH